MTTSNGGSVTPASVGSSLNKDDFELDSFSEPGCSHSLHAVSSQADLNSYTHMYNEPSSLECAGDLSSFALHDSSGEEDAGPPRRKLGARR